MLPMIAEICSGGPVFGDQNLAKWPCFRLSQTDPDLLPGDKLVAIARQSLAAMAAEAEFLYLMMQAISTPEVSKLLEHDFKTCYDEFMTVLAPLFEALGDPQPVAAASLYLAILDGAMLQSLVGATLFDQEQILTQMRERFGL